MTNDIDKRVAEIAALYPAIYRRFHVSRQPLPGETITPRMLWLLQHLRSVGPSTSGEIAQHLGVSKSTATELVDRLAQKKLVERHPDMRDQRRVFVGLTERGEEFANRPLQVLENTLLRSALRQLSEKEASGLVLGMRALVRAGEVSAIALIEKEECKK